MIINSASTTLFLMLLLLPTWIAVLAKRPYWPVVLICNVVAFPMWAVIVGVVVFYKGKERVIE